jgi:hypothetical protein
MSLWPKTDEYPDIRRDFHQWCVEQGIDDELWMPNQPWCGYKNERVQDHWLGFLGHAVRMQARINRIFGHD